MKTRIYLQILAMLTIASASFCLQAMEQQPQKDDSNAILVKDSVGFFPMKCQAALTELHKDYILRQEPGSHHYQIHLPNGTWTEYPLCRGLMNECSDCSKQEKHFGNSDRDSIPYPPSIIGAALASLPQPTATDSVKKEIFTICNDENSDDDSDSDASDKNNLLLKRLYSRLMHTKRNTLTAFVLMRSDGRDDTITLNTFDTFDAVLLYGVGSEIENRMQLARAIIGEVNPTGTVPAELESPLYPIPACLPGPAKTYTVDDLWHDGLQQDEWTRANTPPSDAGEDAEDEITDDDESDTTTTGSVASNDETYEDKGPDEKLL